MSLLQNPKFLSSFLIIYCIPTFSPKSIAWPYWRDGNRCMWAKYCEYEGHDLSSQQGPGEECSGMCADHGTCTHFTWTKYNGGTCWLKRGDNLQPKRTAAETTVCGYVERVGGGGSSNQEWPDWRDGDRCKWANYCEYEGHNLSSRQGSREACSAICAEHGSCKHFTWTKYNGGTCWLKRGDNLQPKRTAAETSICGYVQLSVGGGNSNQAWPDWRDGDRCKWANYCEYEGHNLSSRQGSREACSAICAEHGSCKHFTWTKYNGGTCWLKRGDNLQPKHTAAETTVCGYVERVGGGGSSNQGAPAVQKNALMYLLLIVACFALIGLVILAALLRWQHKTKVALLKQLHMQLMATTNWEKQLKLDPSVPIQQQTENLPYDEAFELPSGCIDLRKVIGQGEFGKVYHAFAYLEGIEEPVQVAVKVPRDGMNVEHQNSLLSELKIMIYLGCHVNILGLVGAITRNMTKGELCVVTEYSKYASLLEFLRRRRNLFVDEIIRLNSSTELRANNGNDNDGYWAPKPMRITYRVTPQQDPTWSDHLVSDQAASGFIYTTDLLSFCYQTSNGMAFLASKNLIHRDLAARNVLLADGFVVKICDFGLARNDNTYQIKKSLHVPLPLRWMALESITLLQHTEKSDVWSFGVLVWEVFTLGEVPYPQANFDENFVHMLKNGHRLQQPVFCPDDVYALMRRCWAENPDLRPNFVECKAELETQLGLCSIQKLEQVKRLLLAVSSGTGFNPQETSFNPRSLDIVTRASSCDQSLENVLVHTPRSRKACADNDSILYLRTTAETSFCTAQNPAYFASVDARRLSLELSESAAVPLMQDHRACGKV